MWRSSETSSAGAVGCKGVVEVGGDDDSPHTHTFWMSCLVPLDKSHFTGAVREHLALHSGDSIHLHDPSFLPARWSCWCLLDGSAKSDTDREVLCIKVPPRN